MIATKPPTPPPSRDQATKPPAPTPTGGYRIRRIPWAWIVGGSVAALILGNLIHARLTAAEPLPEGLIQANGRIEGDHVVVASKYAGRIGRLGAREGDSVAQGQILLVVDDPETRAKRDQQASNLAAVVAQAQASGSNVDLTRQTGDAVILQARGLVNQSEAAVDSARADASRASAAVETAQAAKGIAAQNVLAVEAAFEEAKSNRDRALAGLEGAKAALASAQASLRAAQAGVLSAKASSDQAAREAKRYSDLSAQGAVSGQRGEQARTASDQAAAQLSAANEQVNAAQAGVAGRTSDVESARHQLKVAEATIRQAEAQLRAARQQVISADSGIRQAAAQRTAAQAAIQQGEARTRQSLGQLNQALTAPTQVKVSQSTQSSAEAKVAEARHALQEVDNILAEMSVRSPIAGTVVTRFQDQGELVSAGSPVLELVNLDRLYLKVYVPENMIGKIRLGLPAQIWTDAYPKEPFPAKIGYISAQAEFTPKEIQTATERVSLMYEVRLYLDQNPGHRLNPGLPADAVIRWKDGVAWQKPR